MQIVIDAIETHLHLFRYRLSLRRVWTRTDKRETNQNSLFHQWYGGDALRFRRYNVKAHEALTRRRLKRPFPPALWQRT